MAYKVVTFYKYVQIEKPEELMHEIREYSEKKDVLGRILLGKEGINGGVSAKKEDIEKFKDWIRSKEKFSDLSFREHDAEENAYHKLVVKVRDEIVHFGKDVDLSKKGNYVTPDELKQMYEDDEDFIIVDARNDYEYKIGKFKDAVELPIKNFRDLPEKVDELQKYKEKKVVMYCTGGIRCEKATAYLKEKGFKDVNHLQGGIIDFNNEFPDTYFKGSNFVFDDRLASSQDLLVDCELCGNSATNYLNCHNLDCDRLYGCCDKCLEKYNKCCSLECKNAPRQRPERKDYEVLAVVKNYYRKADAALVKTRKPIKKNIKVYIKGKTTDFEQEIKEIRSYDEKEINNAKEAQLVTIPVKKRVRENDKILVEV